MAPAPTGNERSRPQRAARLRQRAEQERSSDAASTGPSSAETESPTGAATPEAEPATREDAPVGQGEYIVREHDCMMSIAHRSGFFWETIWDDPANAELKNTRGNAKVLFEGDRVTVPEKRRKEESGETEMLHRFRRKGEPAKLRIRFCDEGEPRAGEPFVVEIDGHETQQGETDPAGTMEIFIPTEAGEGIVRVGTGENETEYVLNIGGLAPADTVRGVQQRLKNLGLYVGEADGELGPPTQMSLKTFQDLYELSPTGVPDAPTIERLREVHGS